MSERNIPGKYYGGAGPFVHAVCPKCARFMRLPKKIKVNEATGKIKGRFRCSKCGPVTPNYEYI